MRISSFVLLLSLLANLSFARLSGDSLTTQANFENMDTVSRDGLNISLVGDWTKIGQDQGPQSFASLSIFADGKFKGVTGDGQRVSGDWELSSDGQFIALHKISEETGKRLETVLAQIELADGHTLTLKSTNVQAKSQTFIQ